MYFLFTLLVCGLNVRLLFSALALLLLLLPPKPKPKPKPKPALLLPIDSIACSFWRRARDVARPALDARIERCWAYLRARACCCC